MTNVTNSFTQGINYSIIKKYDIRNKINHTEIKETLVSKDISKNFNNNYL